MTFFRDFSPLFLIALFAFAFLLATLTMWPGVALAGSNSDCTAIPNLRIKVGNTLLSVPRRYAPTIFVPEGKSVGHAKDICQRPGDPAIEARWVMFIPGTDRRIELAPDSITGPVWHVRIEIYEHFSSFRTPAEAFEHAVNLIERNGRRLTELPQKHGFFAYDDMPHSPNFYIALQETTVWPDPAPFVIKCSADELPSPTEGVHCGRTCRTPYLRSFSDTLSVRYNFYDGRHPIETWNKLDASVHAFVQSLVKDGT